MQASTTTTTTNSIATYDTNLYINVLVVFNYIY